MSVATNAERTAAESTSRFINLIVGIKGDKEQADEIKVTAENRVDSFEVCAQVTELLCECYPNYQVIKGMPASVFGDKFGYDMQDEIGKCMSDFYAGKISRSDVEYFFAKCCTDMRIYRTKQRQTSGTDADDLRQIVSQVYEVFAKENQRAACRANYNEGRALNDTYGGLKEDWVYYNSDYYHKCADGNEMLRNTLNNMVDKWEIEPVDPDEVERNSCLTLDGGFDFNSGWNFEFRNQTGRGSIADESVEPPRDFVFFYKEKFSADMAYSEDKGYLYARFGSREHITEISFSLLKNGSFKGQIYTLCDLLLNKAGVGSEYSRFLSNITVFTRQYAYLSGINDRCGNYTPKLD